MPFLSRRLAIENGPSLRIAFRGEADRSIVFLHGVGRRWQTFLPLMPCLTDSWRFYGLDHRGHGESDRTVRYLVADYFADTVEALKRLANRPVVLYGHSLGALVAALVAAELPDLVRAVVLEDPPSPGFLARLQQSAYRATFQVMKRHAGPTEQSVGLVARQLAEAIIEKPDGSTVRLGELRDPLALRFTARCLREVDPNVYDPLVENRWLDGLDWWDRVATIRCPALLLYGDVSTGGMLPAEDAAELVRRVSDLTPIRLVGAGHVLHWQHTATIMTHLIGFLESL